MIKIPWLPAHDEFAESAEFLPVVPVILHGSEGSIVDEVFVIDSGADISLASRKLLDDLGFDWLDGRPITLHGISSDPRCSIDGRVFEVDVAILPAEIVLPIPICFADAETSCLLGRQVFFDVFDITLSKSKLMTSLELLI